ncbi:hypothetical protein L198_06700 [Cryptococcus wingfieldii CBS 7118]|uniref:Uncharacterized protein n=1 Tax=Cryptococcus wingfieldii CBS 7118 TaxID=1295528 RepID=A0A1E3IIK7_9TREE|nr:hypothetical protein L198_06700 [Cryptococcus wingfieldii CBS 7118]ODN88429.1 hypothetical protein L198_06700 [Cryptococcus wingfieldii CBS 7118]
MSQTLKLPDTPHPQFLIPSPHTLHHTSLSPSPCSFASTTKVPRCLTPYPTRFSYSPLSSPLTGVSGVSLRSPVVVRASSPLSAVGMGFEGGDGEEEEDEDEGSDLERDERTTAATRVSAPVPITLPTTLPPTLRMSKLSSLSPSSSFNTRRLPLSPVPPRMLMKRRTTLPFYAPNEGVDSRTGRKSGFGGVERRGEKGKGRKKEEKRPEPLSLPKLKQARVRILTPYPSPSPVTPSPSWCSSGIWPVPSPSPMSLVFADDYADIPPAPAPLTESEVKMGMGIVTSMSKVDLRMRDDEDVYTLVPASDPPVTATGVQSGGGLLTASFETPRVVISGAGVKCGVGHVD